MAAKKAATKKNDLPAKADETELAGLRARIKQLETGQITDRERRAIEKWRRAEAEAMAETLLHNIPKGVYCALAGRQQKVVDEFGRRYDIPVDVPSIDLYAVVSELHTRISEFAAAARPNLEADEAELVREKLRQEIGKLQRQSATIQIELDRHMDRLLAKHDVQAGLDWLSNKLRAMGTRLARECGQAGVDALNELLNEFADEAENGTLRF